MGCGRSVFGAINPTLGFKGGQIVCLEPAYEFKKNLLSKCSNCYFDWNYKERRQLHKLCI